MSDDDVLETSKHHGDLRTRIAAAIESVRIQRDGDSYKMADAVIRELEAGYVLVPRRPGNAHAFKYGEHYGI